MSRYKPSMTLDNTQIEELYKGSIDMHLHVGPDPLWNRRLDTYGTALAAQEGGMKAFVAKSYFYPTTTEARIVSNLVENVSAIGSITIGYTTTGGLEYAPETVEAHAKMGCKVIWFPAYDAAACKMNIEKRGGITILDSEGKLRTEAKEVLKIAKKYNMVVCKGHMSFPETEALFKEAVSMGITKLITTHPLSDIWGKFSMEQIKELADMGAYTEIVFLNLMPRLGALDPADYIDLVKEIGAERMIMSTDFAQCMDPTPAEGMRFFIGTMLQFGCTKAEVELMVKVNPIKLLDI